MFFRLFFMNEFKLSFLSSNHHNLTRKVQYVGWILLLCVAKCAQHHKIILTKLRIWRLTSCMIYDMDIMCQSKLLSIYIPAFDFYDVADTGLLDCRRWQCCLFRLHSIITLRTSLTSMGCHKRTTFAFHAVLIFLMFWVCCVIVMEKHSTCTTSQSL